MPMVPKPSIKVSPKWQVFLLVLEVATVLLPDLNGNFFFSPKELSH
jgi:hypothetical protein